MTARPSRQTPPEIPAQREELFRLLVQTVRDYAIFMLDPDGQVVSWNEGAMRAKGYTAEEIIGQHFSVFYTPEDRATGRPQENLRKAAEQGRLEDEGWRVRKDGTRFWADVILTAVRDPSGKLRGFAKITRDMTEKRRNEELLREKQQQIMELQKMEAIGRLTGGIAHDFNNLVAGLIGCNEVLENLVQDNPEAMAEVDAMKSVLERAHSLTRQLLAFSRRQVATPTRLQANTMVREVEKMTARMVGAHIKTKLTLADNLPAIFMDAGQMQQILVNLIVNARDAMPNGGQLVVETFSCVLDRYSIADEFSIQAGPYVAVAVTDNGQGMSEEVRKRVFEPFFTTKPVGQGTGLGLSTVYGILQQNHGAASLASVPGIGTTFTVYFPVADKPPEAPPEAALTRPTVPGTLLVCFGDESLMRGAVHVLQSLGYATLSAATAQQAREIFEKAKGRIELVITDIMTLGSDSRGWLEELRAAHPRLRVLYLSGFAAELEVGRRLGAVGGPILRKPITAQVLAREVAHALGARPFSLETGSDRGSDGLAGKGDSA